MTLTTGLHAHRFRDNPEGQRFAEMWTRMGLDGRNLDYLLTPAPQNHEPLAASGRDRQVAATIIQWLGSPVGQGFLREMGYEKVK